MEGGAGAGKKQVKEERHFLNDWLIQVISKDAQQNEGCRAQCDGFLCEASTVISK